MYINLLGSQDYQHRSHAHSVLTVHKNHILTAVSKITGDLSMLSNSAVVSGYLAVSAACEICCQPLAAQTHPSLASVVYVQLCVE